MSTLETLQDILIDEFDLTRERVAPCVRAAPAAGGDLLARGHASAARRTGKRTAPSLADIAPRRGTAGGQSG